MKILCLLAVTVSLATLCACATYDAAATHERQSIVTPLVCDVPSSGVCVRVVAATTLAGIRGITVFIIAQDGREIARGQTDDQGLPRSTCSLRLVGSSWPRSRLDLLQVFVYDNRHGNTS